jgi:hypothetical protein
LAGEGVVEGGHSRYQVSYFLVLKN